MSHVLLLCSMILAGGSFDRQIPLTNNKANELFEAQDYQAALDAYLEAYQLDRTNGALAYNIANTYHAMGDSENAATYYQKALEGDHDQARQFSEFNLGNLDMAQQKPGEAIKRYVNYLKNQPNDIDAKRNLELALRQLQQQQQQQQQNEQNQDQENQDQQQQDQQSQSQQQENQDQQNQDQNQSSQNERQDQENQQQNQQDQNQQDQNQQDQQQDKNQQDQNQQDQQQDKNQQQQDQKQQQEQKEAPNPKEGDKGMDENLKKQILDALNEQEQQQQKAHQQRKIGKVKRRSKDW